jgi:glucose/arabinose dehydrogenase
MRLTLRRIGRLAVMVVVAASIAVAAAQQGGQAGQAPGGGAAGGRAAGGRAGGGAFAPPAINWPAPPLPDGPIAVQSAEPAHRNLRLRVTKGLANPWGMAFLPDGTMLVTERAGRLRVIRNGMLDPAPVAGVPAVAAGGLNGLMDIALHPRFAENRFVYLTYHKPIAAPPAAPPAAGGGRGGGTPFTLVLGRGTWDGKALTNVQVIFDTGINASASRIVFGRDGMIYMSSGNATEGVDAPPQDPNDHRGKVLRLRDDGSVPPDNPFAGRAGYKPAIFSMGHRTQLGIAINPETGELWAGEQGPNGGDEINIVRAGRNYGWPIVSQGRSYMGTRVIDNPTLQRAARNAAEFVEPHVSWVPSIALSGLTFYTGDVFPSWKRNVFVGGLRQGEVPRTGQLQRIVFNAQWEEIRREPMLRELGQRIRDVRQGPDGYLYVLTEEANGALLRMEPGDAPQ